MRFIQAFYCKTQQIILPLNGNRSSEGYLFQVDFICLQEFFNMIRFLFQALSEKGSTMCNRASIEKTVKKYLN